MQASVQRQALSGTACSEGGGGNRIRVSDDVTNNNGNCLGQCTQYVAALWLHSPDSDEHDVARVGRIIEAWPSLPDHIKLVVEALCIQPVSCDK